MMGLFGKTEAKATATDATDRVWHGADSLLGLLTPIADLKLDEHNARRHPERNLEAIYLSFVQFGQRKPIVIHEGVAIAGNGSLIIAQRMGWSHIAAVDASDLSADQARAYAIADNKTGDLAEWDFQGLADAIRDLPEDLRLSTGFADFELEPLLQGEFAGGVQQTGEEKGGVNTGGVVFHTTVEQAEVMRRAIAKVRESEDGGDMTDGRALELICADYLAGA